MRHRENAKNKVRTKTTQKVTVIKKQKINEGNKMQYFSGTNTYLMVGFILGSITSAFTVILVCLIVSPNQLLPNDQNNIHNVAKKVQVTSSAPVQFSAQSSAYMQHNQQINEYVSPHVVPVLRLLNPQECDIIIKTLEKRELMDGLIKHGTSSDEKKGTNAAQVRRSKMTGVYKNEWPWLYEKIINQLNYLNKKYWNFQLPQNPNSKLFENIQFALYNYTDQGEYNWHQDTGVYGHTAKRTISAVIQLSRPEDYEGGELEIRDNMYRIIKSTKDQGSIIFFRSFLLHRVTPVTKGYRRSLAIWIQGLDFP